MELELRRVIETIKQAIKVADKDRLTVESALLGVAYDAALRALALHKELD